MDPDIHTASGAYVLHALPDDERRAFESHLAVCTACRDEVAELRATAVRLGDAPEVALPGEARDRVLARVAATQQEPTLTKPAAQLWTGLTRRKLPQLVLAACVALAVAFGGIAVWQHQEAKDARASAHAAEQREASVAEIFASPDASLQRQELSGGGVATVAVSRSQDTAAVVVSGLPELPADKVYEAWFVGSGGPVPAGLLSRKSGRQLAVLDGPVAQAQAVAFTVEPAGGSKQPTTKPIGAVNLPA
ncbi:anti-sigma factor domain-containing protein [Streptomyces sp. NPDC058685]|uniref:anti-sigma factor n=1 Tax=Streptomyces sp. NPDC058685 TaxID=3346598 RepID=UPI003659DD87